MRMLEEKAGQEEAVQAATAKVTAVEEFGENLDGKVIFASDSWGSACLCTRDKSMMRSEGNHKYSC